MRYIVKSLVVSFALFMFVSTAEASESIQLTSEISNVSNKVNNIFTYEIVPFDTNPSGATNEPKTVTLEFTDVIPNNSYQVIANVNIDFSSTQYSKIGDYYYKIKEKASSNDISYPLSDQEYTIVVSVTKKNGEFYKDVLSQAFDGDANKTDILYSHSSQYSYINIEAYTVGNTQNLDEYFKYKIVIFGQTGDRYFISGQDNNVTFEGQTIVTTNYYEVKENENNFAFIYLKRNQKITIGLICPQCIDGGTNQIPIGTKYSLTKMSARKWYTTINNDANADYQEFVLGSNSDNNLVVIKNEQNYDVAITGMFLNYLPYVFLIVIAVVIILIFIIFKNRRDEDEEDNDDK